MKKDEPILYKYLRREHARSMMDKGELRIGTLFNFRQQETRAREDRNEGKKDSIASFPEAKTITNAEEFDALGIFDNSNITYKSGNVVIEKGTRLIKNEDVKNTYVYCCSREYSEALREEFEVDCCVEIHNASRFLLAVANKLSALGLIYSPQLYPGLASVGDCQYIGHEVDHAVNTSGNWLKDIAYKHQCEVRFSFVPIMRIGGQVLTPTKTATGHEFPNRSEIEINIEPTLITCRSAVRYCRWRP